MTVRLESFVPSMRDWLLAVSLAALGLGEALTSATNPRVEFVAASALLPLALAWRRSAPIPVVVLAAAGLVIISELNQGNELTLTAWLLMLLGMGSLGLEVSLSQSLPVLAFAGFFFFVGPFIVGDEDKPSLLDVGFMTVGYGGAFLAGAVIRSRSLRARTAEIRSRELEQVQEDSVRAAVERERARMARELHDIVSHSISVITVQTQAVRRRLGPEYAREADDLRAVETVARQAMAEMRRLLGLLRANGAGADLQPQPGLSQLDNLLRRTRDAGVAVSLQWEGTPQELPPGTDLAAYRIIQESLTNVLKHAPDARVNVALRYTEHHLEIEVENDGTPVAVSTSATGQGLVGMRERVSLYGGELSVGRSDDESGFRVWARLPLREEALRG